jgi:hypothetical protein
MNIGNQHTVQYAIDNLKLTHEKSLKNRSQQNDSVPIKEILQDFKYFSGKFLNFTNGIYDFDNKWFVPLCAQNSRELKPLIDKINTGYKYDTYDWDSYLEMEEYLKQIMPDNEQFENFMLMLASFLSTTGTNADYSKCHLNMWIGTGNASLSTMIHLLADVFGKYCCQISCNESNEHILNHLLENKRIVIVQELDVNDLKCLESATMHDNIKKLNKVVCEINSSPNLILSVSSSWTPPQKFNPKAEVNYAHFTSKFVSLPSAHGDYMADESILDKLQRHKECLMNVLINKYYPKLQKLYTNNN